MRKFSLLSLLIVLPVLLLQATPASAEHLPWADANRDGRWDRYDRYDNRYDRYDSRYDRRDSNVYVNFDIDNRDREIIRRYYVNHCPPGLAKKHRCKYRTSYYRYGRGEVIPENVYWYDVPQPLLMQLRQPPRGMRYVVIDGDLYLVSDSRRVIDNVSVVTVVR